MCPALAAPPPPTHPPPPVAKAPPLVLPHTVGVHVALNGEGDAASEAADSDAERAHAEDEVSSDAVPEDNPRGDKEVAIRPWSTSESDKSDHLPAL